jgi:hypothetical protein
VKIDSKFEIKLGLGRAWKVKVMNFVVCDVFVVLIY